MRTVLCLIFLLSSFEMMGCDEPAVVKLSSKKRRNNKKSKDVSTRKTADCRELTPNLIAADWNERTGLVDEAKSSSLRDPFEVSAENLVEEEQETEQQGDPRLESVVDGYEVSELQFTMAVTGQPPSFALLKDPSGFGHDVYVGDIVGSKPRMRVEAITSNEIIFQAVERVQGSEVPRVHRKSLLTPEELQELQP